MNGVDGKNDSKPAIAVTFRPPTGLRVVWLLSPIVVLGGCALVAALYLDLTGPTLVTVVAAGACGGLLLGLRGFAIGICYGSDRITVRNALRTIRVPAGRLSRFVWNSGPTSDDVGPEPSQDARESYPPGGLWMEYVDGANIATTVPVSAFNRRTNPVAPVADGYRTWIALEELRRQRRHRGPKPGPAHPPSDGPAFDCRETSHELRVMRWRNLLLWVVAIALLALFVTLALAEADRADRLQANGNRTTGTITAVNRGLRRTSIDVRYVTPIGMLIRTIYVKKFTPEMKPGQTIVVIYDSKNPGSMTIEAAGSA